MMSEEAIAHHAALIGAVKVKPLVWQEKAGESYRQANSAIGMYQVSWLGEPESWQLYCPGSQGRDWRENFSWHSSSAEAKAAAQADYEARILSALEPDHTREAERIELARQNAALRAQVASLTADNEALQRTVAEKVASAEAAIQALRLHQAWSDSEDAGPDYGDQSRDTHPDGERIWRQWWEGNLSLCARAQDETRNALAAWEASK